MIPVVALFTPSLPEKLSVYAGNTALHVKEIFIFCVNKYNKFVIVIIFRLFTIYNNLTVIVVLYSLALFINVIDVGALRATLSFCNVLPI